MLGNWNNLLESDGCLNEGIWVQFFEGANRHLEEISGRLVATADIPHPLESVHARCRILRILFQTVNRRSFPHEAVVAIFQVVGGGNSHSEVCDSHCDMTAPTHAETVSVGACRSVAVATC